MSKELEAQAERQPSPLRPTGPGPWEIYNRQNDNVLAPLGQFNRAGAEEEAAEYLSSRRQNPADYGVRTTGSSTAFSAPATTQRSEYELYLKSSGRVVTAPSGNPIIFSANSPDDAANKIARYINDFNLAGEPSDYDVRSVLSASMAGSTLDLQRQRAAAAQAVHDAQPVREWNIMLGDQQVFRVRAGTQGEANERARQWLQQRSPEFSAHWQSQELTVVPVTN